MLPETQRITHHSLASPGHSAGVCRLHRPIWTIPGRKFVVYKTTPSKLVQLEGPLIWLCSVSIPLAIISPHHACTHDRHLLICRCPSGFSTALTLPTSTVDAVASPRVLPRDRTRAFVVDGEDRRDFVPAGLSLSSHLPELYSEMRPRGTR